MGWLYSWTADILCVLVLMSLLEMLLPSKKYVRYIRFFAGVVLILVAVQPLLGGAGLAQEIDRYFSEFSFQTEVRDIRRDVLGIEEERRRQMLSSGEEAAAADVETMVRESGFIPVWTEVKIGKDAESENYGEVVRVTAVVALERKNGAESPASEDQTEAESKLPEATAAKKTEISSVKLEIAQVEIEPLEESDNVVSEPEKVPDSADLSQEPGMSAAVDNLAELKRKVGRFYELEPENVEIQLERR